MSMPFHPWSTSVDDRIQQLYSHILCCSKQSCHSSHKQPCSLQWPSWDSNCSKIPITVLCQFYILATKHNCIPRMMDKDQKQEEIQCKWLDLLPNLHWQQDHGAQFACLQEFHQQAIQPNAREYPWEGNLHRTWPDAWFAIEDTRQYPLFAMIDDIIPPTSRAIIWTTLWNTGSGTVFW